MLVQPFLHCWGRYKNCFLSRRLVPHACATQSTALFRTSPPIESPNGDRRRSVWPHAGRLHWPVPTGRKCGRRF